jgi:hypothetical protein
VTDTTLTPAVDAPTGSPVEGSGGLLLEIDGKIVPNYAATMVSFEEGDVVKGRVVRIDKDEVLVDIGYKSEGVIPSHELSIRKSVNPAASSTSGCAASCPPRWSTSAASTTSTSSRARRSSAK